MESSGDLGDQTKNIDDLLLEGRQKAKRMNYEGALKSYNEVLKIDPKNARALNNRGSIYYQMNNMEEALTNFEMALIADPNLLEAEYGKGIVYYAQNRLVESKASLEMYVSNAPPTQQAYIQSAQQFLANLNGHNPASSQNPSGDFKQENYYQPSEEMGKLINQFNEGGNTLSYLDLASKISKEYNRSGNNPNPFGGGMFMKLLGPAFFMGLISLLVGFISSVAFQVLNSTPDVHVGNLILYYFQGDVAIRATIGMIGSFLIGLFALNPFTRPYKLLGIISVIWAVAIIILIGLYGILAAISFGYMGYYLLKESKKNT